MKINIYSIISNIFYNNIDIINIYNKNISYSLMNNHIPYIGETEIITFLKNNKLIKIKLFNAFYIQKKNILTIICNKYLIY